MAVQTASLQGSSACVRFSMERMSKTGVTFHMVSPAWGSHKFTPFYASSQEGKLAECSVVTPEQRPPKKKLDVRRVLYRNNQLIVLFVCWIRE